MSSSAQLRQQIEATLARRVPGALSPRLRTEQETIASGVKALDELLQGGLPAGALTELVGPECSGRTSVALSVVAGMTLAGRVCAWVDVSDTLDPETAAANGVDLERLLWVRCGGRSGSQPNAVDRTGPSSLQLAAGIPAEPQTVRGGGSPHPRSEGQGMPQAIARLLDARPYYAAMPQKRRDRSIGTPGVPNRPLTFRSEDREEQVATDRQPARRGETVLAPRRAETVPNRRPVLQTAFPPAAAAKPKLQDRPVSVYSALDQAIRTVDLLLQAGGFCVIVFDLGSTPAEIAWRIPLASWFRFRAACERSRVSLLLLTQHACARSSAGLVVRMAAGRMEFDKTVMSGVAYHAERERQRFEAAPAKVVSIRKPPRSERGTSASWSNPAAWAETR